MKKDKKQRTEIRLEESIRKKAAKIAKQETGESSMSAGIRIAIRAYNLDKEKKK